MGYAIFWHERVMLLNTLTFYLGEDSPALQYAKTFLKEYGCRFSSTPDRSVTHCLLPVPSINGSGQLRSRIPIEQLPEDCILIGGKLPSELSTTHSTWDLLQDEYYLAQNAAITAHCAVKEALSRMDVTLQDCPVLIIGWGRIGKCLGQLLQAIGARVAIAARKEKDLTLLQSLNFTALSMEKLTAEARKYAVIFNTVPSPVLHSDHCAKDSLLIELASSTGIEGDRVVQARGLPGKDAPRSSGVLIGQTILRLLKKEETL